jgi:hypothetical protein
MRISDMRKIFSVLFSLLALVTASSAFGLSMPLSAIAAPAHHDMKSSAEACANCATTCEKTLEYLKGKGGKHAEARNLDKLKDCIALCKASADLKGRNSAHAAKLDQVCKDVCSQCAAMCKELKDPALADCIKSCETCHDCCG